MGVVWLSIDSSHFCKEKSEEIKKFRAEFEPPYPILLDPSGKVGRLYGAKTTPHVFVIDRDGKIVYAGAPDNDATREEGEPFRFYVDEVLEALVVGKEVPVSKKKPYGCSVKYKS
jgi:peroxiredoxin